MPVLVRRTIVLGDTEPALDGQTRSDGSLLTAEEMVYVFVAGGRPYSDGYLSPSFFLPPFPSSNHPKSSIPSLSLSHVPAFCFEASP